MPFSAVSTEIDDVALHSPKHIAVIMDGNGRWARARHLPLLMGHKKGVESARKVVSSCLEHAISYLTLYTFSAENWNRPLEEVQGLMKLMRYYLKSEIAPLHKEGVSIRFIGDRSLLSPQLCDLISGAEALTSANTRLHLTLAFSYGGRQEIAFAMKSIAQDVEKGIISSKAVNEALIERYLYTHNTPDPDLLIRTSGEQRISNFLLWQSAYTEFYFTPVLWPEFDEVEFKNALNNFSQRQRRYGK